MVLELFSILTMVVNTTTYKYDKIVCSMQMNTEKWGNLNKIAELYQYSSDHITL